MRYSTIFPAIFLLVSLAACGGGGGGNESGASAPPAPPAGSDGVIPPTAPAAPPLSPTVSTVSPTTANIGMTTVFTLNGNNLPDGMKFSLTDCADIAELSGGSSTQRQFRCTPVGKSGARDGAVYASVNAPSSLLGISVDYQAVALFVANLNWRYAVIKSDRSLWTWNPQQPTPIQVGDDYADVAVSTNATLAIKTDGSLWSWGIDNSFGIQGNGTTSPSIEPKQIGTDFVKVVIKGENTTGGECAEALKKDGSVWVWGARSLAQPNAVEPELSPRMIATDFVDIARGAGGESLGIKRDGSLWTWNRNLSDQPFALIKIADGYIRNATSYAAAYGLKADHSLWNWERNAPDQAGTAPTASAPVKVGDDFLSISAGTYYALALKSDGTLWAGGNGEHGEFGDGQSGGGTFRQVNSGIADAWAGSTCSFVKKTDGSLWAAGLCDLGDGKFIRYISTLEPVGL